MTNQQLIDLLDSDDPGIRRDAARELGIRGAAEALPALMSALRPRHSSGDDDREEDLLEHSARAAAAVALGRIGDADATPALLDAARDGFKLGSAASTALAQLEPPPIEALLRATSSENRWLRARSASALGEIGDPRGFDSLVRLLRDPEDVVRRAAASAFEKMRDPRAVDPLVDLLDDATTSNFVKIYVAMSLGAIGDRSAVSSLLRETGSTDSNVRRAASRALCRIGAPETRAELARLASEDPDKTVRDVIAHYLSKTDEP